MNDQVSAPEGETGSGAGASGTRDDVPRRRPTVWRSIGYVALAFVIGVGLFGAYTYRKLNANLNTLDLKAQLGERPDAVEVEGPADPLNILVMGTDTRAGANNIDGAEHDTELSDVTLLLHVSADRSFAYGVSLPRDAMVERPTCFEEDGTTEISGGLALWNAAYSVGGAACTVRQVEQLTDIRIDHFVKVDFAGFKDMVDAIGGVEICVPEEVSDPETGIHLAAGTRMADGDEALDYVRIRKNISPNGDIGRMKRQQVFIASMIDRVMSKGVLGRPDRLVKFLYAATRSLTFDDELDSIAKIAELVGEMGEIGLDSIKFVTVPWAPYEPHPAQIVWTDDADGLWQRIKHDQPLSKRLSSDVIQADRTPGASSSASPDGTSSTDGADEGAVDSDRPTEAERAATAAANGLCA